MRPARFKSAQPAKERTQDAAFVSTNAPFCINHKLSVSLSVEEVQTFPSILIDLSIAVKNIHMPRMKNTIPSPFFVVSLFVARLR